MLTTCFQSTNYTGEIQNSSFHVCSRQSKIRKDTQTFVEIQNNNILKIMQDDLSMVQIDPRLKHSYVKNRKKYIQSKYRGKKNNIYAKF